jgi:hypothetical protein
MGLYALGCFMLLSGLDGMSKLPLFWKFIVMLLNLKESG